MNHKTGYEIRCPKFDGFTRELVEEVYVKWYKLFNRANNGAIQLHCEHPKPETIVFRNLTTGKRLKIGTWPETELGAD
jgi:hypothetical protein